MNTLKSIDLYTLDGSVVWYVISISIKLFKKGQKMKSAMYKPNSGGDGGAGLDREVREGRPVDEVTSEKVFP